MPADTFPIDLANPQDIQAKMPEIRALYGNKREELKGLTVQVELLARILGEDLPSTLAEPQPKATKGPSKAGQNAPSQDRAVRALEHANRPMGPTSLFKYMEDQGMDLPSSANALGSNLWSAWKAGRIMRAPNGVYTPLDGSGRAEWDRPLTDYDFAAANGMPAPSPSGPSPNGSLTAGAQASLQTQDALGEAET